MSHNDSAIAALTEPLLDRASASGAAPDAAPASEATAASSPAPHPRTGLWWGLLGVFAFSFTVPLTHFAVLELNPLFVGAGRAVVAGILALGAIVITRQRLPRAGQWARLGLVTLGVVCGFSLFTTFALQTAPASHAAVVIGLLPAVTAVLAVLRGREHPSALFWIASIAGAASVIAFTAIANGGLGAFQLSDLLLFLAVLCAALGYSEGALLAREIGAWQTIAWALVLGLPVTVTLTTISVLQSPPQAGMVPWLCFAYLSCISMFLGFLPWYRGLAIGPVTTVSQTQLVQPVLSLVWSALLIGEVLDLPTIAGGMVVIAFAWLALRARVSRKA